MSIRQIAPVQGLERHEFLRTERARHHRVLWAIGNDSPGRTGPMTSDRGEKARPAS